MIDGIILSFQLFSRIPLKKNVDFNKKNLNIALTFLPIMGLIIGAITGFVVDVFNDKSNMVAGAIGLLCYFVLSGGLHLDGLSDMVDGFLSNAEREKILEIMKDSLIGTFGSLALVTYGILKFALYGSMVENTIISIALASFISRISSLYVIRRGGLARPGGFGSKMKEALTGSKIVFINGLLVLILAYFEIRVFIALVVSLLVAEILVRISTKKIGGLTGDIYGATIEINEILSLLVVWGIYGFNIITPW